MKPLRPRWRQRAQKFGKLTKTPAMQAGLVSRRLTLRDIFIWPLKGSLVILVLFHCHGAWGRIEAVGKAGKQHLVEEAPADRALPMDLQTLALSLWSEAPNRRSTLPQHPDEHLILFPSFRSVILPPVIDRARESAKS